MASAAWNVNAAGAWNLGTNWNPTASPGSTTADNTDVATFSLTLTTGRIITVDANRYIGGITFGNTSAFAYTLSSGSILLNSGGTIQTATTLGTHNDSISSPITISGTSAATASFISNATSSSAAMYFTGSITGSATTGNNTVLTLDGTNTSVNNYISGSFSNGAGGGTLSVVKNGTGFWGIYGGNNTHTGGTTLNAGTLSFSSSMTLPSLTINGGSVSAPATATLINGPVTIAGDFAFASSSSLTFAAAATMTLTGSRTITSASSVSLTLGILAESGGVRNLTKSGTGTGSVILTSSTFTGTITVSQGVLGTSGATSLGASAVATLGDITITSGATLRNEGAFAIDTYRNLILNGTGLSSIGALTNNTATGLTHRFNSITINSSTTIRGSNGTTTLNTNTGSMLVSNPLTLNHTGYNLIRISAPLTGTADISVTGLALASTAFIATLSGTNINTGRYLATQGILTFANRVSLYNANMSSWTTTNLVATANAGGFGFHVGGASEFTSSDIDHIKGLADATGGFAVGSRLVMLPSTSFTYASDISNTINGALSIGVYFPLNGSSYSGVLSLTGNNTFSGGVFISGGANLLVNSDANLGTGTVTIANGYVGSNNTVNSSLSYVSGTGATNAHGFWAGPGATFTVNNFATTTSTSLRSRGGGTVKIAGAISTSLGSLGVGFENTTLDVVNNNVVVLANTTGIQGTSPLTGTITTTITASGTGSLSLTQISATDGTNIAAASSQTIILDLPIVGGNCLETLGSSTTTSIVRLTKSNTYSGSTLVNTGILEFSTLFNLGMGTDIRFNGTSTGTLRYIGTGETISRNITMAASSGTSVIDQSGTGTLVIPAFGAHSAGSKTLTFTGSTAGSGRVDAAILDTLALTVTKAGTGTWEFASPSSTFSTLNLTGGVLVINGSVGNALTSGRVGSSNYIATFVGGTLRYNGTGETTNRGIALSTNGGTLENNSSTGLIITGTMLHGTTSAKTLTISGTGNTTISSDITNNTGITSVTKSGSGIFYINTNYSYTGTTTLSGGVITLNVASGIAQSTLAMSGGSLRVDDSLASVSVANISATTNGTGYDVRLNTFVSDIPYTLLLSGSNTNTYAGSFSGTGSLTRSGTGTTNLTGPNTYSGTTSVLSGTLTVLSLNTGTSGNVGPSLLSLDGGSGTLSYVGSGETTTKNVTIGTGGTNIGAFGTGAISWTPSILNMVSSASPRNITFTGTSVLNNIFGANISDNGAGAISLTKSGSGTWELSGSLQNTGMITVSTGTLILSGTNTLPGGILVTGSTLRVSSDNNLGNGTVALGSNGVLSLTGSITRAISVGAGNTFTINAPSSDVSMGTISGATTSIMNKTGTGKLTLTSADTIKSLYIYGPIEIDGTNFAISNLNGDTIRGYANTTISAVNGGTLSLGTVSTSLDASDVAALDNFTLTISAPIVGSTGVDVYAPSGSLYNGVLVLSGNNTFTGPLNVNNSTVSVSSIADSGVSSNIGAGSLIRLLSATTGILRYTGATSSTNRAIQFQNNSQSIEVTNSATTLTLNGVITGGSGFRKRGSGVLKLSPTTIASTANTIQVLEGTLILDKSGTVSGGPLVPSLSNISAGATLSLQGSGIAQVWIRTVTTSTTIDGTYSLNGKAGFTGALSGSGTILNTTTTTSPFIIVGSSSSTFTGSFSEGSNNVNKIRLAVVPVISFTVAEIVNSTNSFSGGLFASGSVSLANYPLISRTKSLALAGSAINGMSVVGGSVAFIGISIQTKLLRDFTVADNGNVGIGISPSAATENIDFSTTTGANIGTMRGGALGATSSLTYSGTFTPYNAADIRLGVFDGSRTNVFKYPGNIVDTTLPTSLTISGPTALTGNNTFSGPLSLVHTLAIPSNATASNFGTNNLGINTASSISSFIWEFGSTVDISSGSARPIGGITINHVTTFDTNGNNITLAGSIGNYGASSGGISKVGLGTLTLSGENTFNGGATSVTSGSIILANENALVFSPLNSTTSVSFSSSVLSNRFALGGLTGSTNMSLLNSASTAITLRLVGNTTSSRTYSGVLSGAGSNIEVYSPFTQTLTGANTYTGETRIASGTYGNRYLISVPTLQLDFANATPTSNIISASSVLDMGGAGIGGGWLSITGKSLTTNAQTFASTTLDEGGSIIQITGSPTAVTLTLGAITRNPYSTVSFYPFGTQSATNGFRTTTGTANSVLVSTTGVAYATFSSTSASFNAYDWAAKDATNTFLTVYSGYTAFGTSSVLTGHANITASITATAGSTPETIRISDSTARTLTLGGLVTLSAGAVLFGNTGASSITGGTLAPGGTELVIHANQATTTPVTLSSILANGSGATSVVYTSSQTTSGYSKVSIGNANTYTGNTYIHRARVSVNSGAGTPFGTGDVYVYGHSGGQIYFGNSGTISNNFFISGNGTHEGIATIGQYGVFRHDAGTLSGTITLMGDAAIGAISSTSGVISGPMVGSASYTLTKISVIGTTPGMITLSGNNSGLYSRLRLQAGAIQFNSANSIGNISEISSTGAGGVVANASNIVQTLANRIRGGGTSYSSLNAIGLSITAASAANNIDLSSARHASTLVGVSASTGTITYTGTLTPYQSPTAIAPSYQFGNMGVGGATMVYSGNITGASSLLLGGAGYNTFMYLSLTGTTSFRGGTTFAATSTYGVMLSLPATNPYSTFGNGPITISGNGGSGVSLNASTTVSEADITAATNIKGIYGTTSNGAFLFNQNTVGTTVVPLVFTKSLGMTGNTMYFQKLGTGTLQFNKRLHALNFATYASGTTYINHPDVQLINVFPINNRWSLLSTTGAVTELKVDATLGNIEGTNSTTSTRSASNLHLAGYTLTLAGSNSYTFSGIIYGGSGATGSGGITRTGSGITSLLGQHSYTGPTTVLGGSLNLNFSSISPTPTNIIDPASPLILGGGALIVTGTTSITRTQSFNGTTLIAGGSTLNFSLNSATSLILSLGNITRNVGSAVHFTFAAGTSYTTTTTNTSGTILGGWAVHNSGWATVSANTIGALASYSSSFTTGADVDAPVGTTLTGNTTINSLRLNAASIVDATSGLTVSSGGILVTSSATSVAAIQNGTITSGNGTDLIIHQQSGTNFTISSKITGNISLTRTGLFTSTTIFTNGSNDYTGNTYLSGNIVQVNASGVFSTGTVYLESLGGLNLNDGVTLANNVIIEDGDNGFTTTGPIHAMVDATISGTITVNRSNIRGGATLSSNASAITGQNSTLTVLGAVNATAGQIIRTRGNVILGYAGGGSYDFFSNVVGVTRLAADNAICPDAIFEMSISSGTAVVDLNGYSQGCKGLRNVANTSIYIENSSSTLSTFTLNIPAADGDVQMGEWTYSSTLSGNMNVVKTGLGTQVLSGPNRYTGTTTVNDGVLRITSAASLGLSEFNGYPLLVMGGGTLDCYDCTNVLLGSISGTSGIITDTGMSYGRTELQVVIDSDCSYSGTIADGLDRKMSLFKGGIGTLTLGGNNSFTGRTRVYEGTLEVSTETPNTTSIISSSCEVMNGSRLLTKSGTLQKGRTTLGGTLKMLGGTLQIGDGIEMELPLDRALISAATTDFGNTIFNIDLYSASITSPGPYAIIYSPVPLTNYVGAEAVFLSPPNFSYSKIVVTPAGPGSYVNINGNPHYAIIVSVF